MISHKHHCIFIHIPRTAGTSIESWLEPTPQWLKSPREKHLTAIQAKTLYSKYWNDYFKFTIVRHPYSRSLSLLSRFSRYYGVRVKNSSLHFGRYKQKFGSPITIEHDSRFYTHSDLLALETSCARPYRPHCVYSNMLTEELDAIYKFEDLSSAVRDLAAKLSLRYPSLEQKVAAKRGVDPSLKNDKRSIERINKLYRLDFQAYDYAMTAP